MAKTEPFAAGLLRSRWLAGTRESDYLGGALRH